MINDWENYYRNLEGRNPRPLLVDALPHIGKRALDVGAGDLVDSKYLIDLGWRVTAIDSNDESKKRARAIPNLDFIHASFEDYPFPRDTYDLVSAQYALPFCRPYLFDGMFATLKNSLKKYGIFVGTFFGDRDEWNTPDNEMTFHSRTDVEELFYGMDILLFDETEKDGATAAGTPKHWHTVQIIARKC